MINKRYLPEHLHNLTPIQKRYFRDQHRFILVSAGRRSRKTLIGRRKLLIEALKTPNSTFICAAPTFPQARSVFWDGLKRETFYASKRQYDSSLKIELKNGSQIIVAGLDKPERIEGITDRPVRGIHITETPNLKPNVWSQHIRPMLSDTNGFAILDGVPEGMNFYYDMALFAAGGVIPPTLSQAGSYGDNGDWAFYSWYSSDVLSPAEIDLARAELDEKTFKQEYEGSFENFEGRLYYAFGKHNLKKIKYDPSKTVHIGMDFNVDPMTAVFCHIENNNIYQFGEAYLSHSNTYEMAEYILERFPKENVIVYPDSTGRALNSNATMSDLAILEKYGLTVQARRSNPPTRDRIASVNSMCRNSFNETRYFVDGHNCPKTINDFNKVNGTKEGKEDKKQEKQGLVHISSALGYLIYYNFPIMGKLKDWGV